ncbi:MAG: MarR family EPS-associated transcriptional regulator [Gammaproteobacteria bacterium]|jgi:EPS-associated MarR family transcriptional regulator|nr:MarR family EPS-associated transcriptional regulator [Gammaproteobacteria bacterium]
MTNPDEIRYRILKALARNPHCSQRELAHELGISLGKVNYCLRAIMSRGWVKVDNFRNNPDKRGYAYYLTPKGFEEKARVTLRFLKKRMKEYEAIRREIDELRRETAGTTLSITDESAEARIGQVKS